MSDATTLVRAILLGDCPNETAALLVLERALEREVDPLRYCTLILGLDEALVMRRAAHWLGMEFLPELPKALATPVVPASLEALGEARIVSLDVGGERITFSAPDFFGLLRLKQRLLSNPALRHRHCLVPASAMEGFLVHAGSQALVDHARQGLSKRWPHAVAQLELTKAARWGFVLAVCLLLGLLLMAPYVGQVWLLPAALLLIVAPASLRLAAILHKPPRPVPARRPADQELPVYSVLVPLRDEAHMVPQLAAAFLRMDYPLDKLDVIFVVEERSPSTLAAVKAAMPTGPFRLVEVPDALPRTKPKALDVALPLCRGEFVVVYDAEDTPHPEQLWRAVHRFWGRPNLHCIQAQLLIDNGRDGQLSALFAGEYAGLFTVFLPALARWGLTVPLGGTSNHFRVSTLRRIGGWDAYNVTEDADLGVRLARLRLPVETLSCPTLEAAPTRYKVWHGQRSRWIKGWAQTFIVHNRHPLALLRQAGWRPALAFEVWALGTLLAPLLHTGFLVTLIAQLALGVPIFQGWFSWSGLYLVILLYGYGTAVAMTIVGLHRRRALDLVAYQALLPLYWMLMVPATLRALYELTNNPFHWVKTQHEAVSPHRTLAGVFVPECYEDAAGGGALPAPLPSP